MRRRRILAAGMGLLIAAGLALSFVRPPGPGQVYRFRSDQYGLPGHTALLLRNGECLVLSRSDEDIGRREAASGSERRLFIIAATKPIRSGSDEGGPYLVDEQSGLTARPGHAIDAEIIFDRTTDGFDGILTAGWPLDFGCGRGLAKVFSISRVHR